MTDSEAIRASLADPPTFEAVFQRHFDAVHRFLRRRLAASAAEDLASQTFVEAFDTRKRYRPERPNALPWLLGIATNLMRHHYRDEERQLRAYERTGLDPVLGSPEPSGGQLLAPGGNAACGRKPPPAGRLLPFEGLGWSGYFTDRQTAHWAGSVYGVTRRDVATVKVTFSGGRSGQARTLPSFYFSGVRYFLVAAPCGAEVETAEGLDRASRVVARPPQGAFFGSTRIDLPGQTCP